MTLSVAKIRKGDKPIKAIRRMRRKLYPPKLIRTGGFLLNRKERTKRQERNCEMTVATAAPATPIFKPKMNMGSKIILEMAPIRTEIIPMAANP